MIGLQVLECGPAATMQDRGRFGYRRFGVPTAGAMDGVAASLANALVGNSPDLACIEFQMIGGKLQLEEGPLTLSLTGVAADLRINDRQIPELQSATAGSGDVVTVGPIRSGVYAYLAVGGGFDLKETLGSSSVNWRTGIGGRPLAPGDFLPVHEPTRGVFAGAAPIPKTAGPIRVMPGPQEDSFVPEALQALCGEPFTVRPDSDRMAFRLSGPRLQHAGDANIVSDAVLPGSIQVPASGIATVLMRDCQTTGGYPKIATIISADLDRMARSAPGSEVRFAVATLDEAAAAARKVSQEVEAMLASVQPIPDSQAEDVLYAVNLIDGVTAGR